MTYDLIIIGGGPAGVAGGVYAARKHLKTVLIAEEIGGQSVVSEKIENWIRPDGKSQVTVNYKDGKVMGIDNEKGRIEILPHQLCLIL